MNKILTPEQVLYGAHTEDPDLFDLMDFREAASLKETAERLTHKAISQHSRDLIFYRTVENVIGPGLVICKTHLLELAPYRFDGKPLQVRAIGPKERLYGFHEPTCGLCTSCVSKGNRCYYEACNTELHPQWPAVYCSGECALADQ